MSGSTSNDATVRDLVTSLNDFAFRLFAYVVGREPDANVFLSPPSVSTALGILYQGAGGETERALAKTLSLKNVKAPSFGDAYATMRAAMPRPAGRAALTVVNSLWLGQHIRLRQQFAQAIDAYFGAEIRNHNFADPATPRAINDWVSEATGGKIEGIVKQGELSVNTVLLLLSVSHFKGIWKTRFDESRTEESTFTLPDGSATLLPMMSQSGTYRYCETAGFRGVELPYVDDGLSMFVCLAVGDATSRGFEKSLNLKYWLRVLSQFREMEGDVQLPRFEVSYENTLNDALRNLGAEPAFRPSADFSKLCDSPAFVSEVKHKVAVEVTEEGTEAAAATSVTMSRSMPRRFSFVVNRPFFCIITENVTGLILYIGLIVRP